jgi:hypothetical protein
MFWHDSIIQYAKFQSIQLLSVLDDLLHLNFLLDLELTRGFILVLQEKKGSYVSITVPVHSLNKSNYCGGFYK